MKKTVPFLFMVSVLTLQLSAKLQAGTYEDAVRASNPLAFFELEETSGTLLVNSISPGTYDGTYGSGVTMNLASPSFAGVSNPSVSVSSTEDGLMSVTIPSLGPTSSFSIELLVKSDVPSSSAALFSKGIRDDKLLTVGVLDGGYGAEAGKLYLAPNGPYTASSHTMNGEWIHLVMTYDAANTIVNLYSNGNLVLGDLNVGDAGETAATFTFGQRLSEFPLLATASYSNIAIYDYILDSSAVNDHWQAIPEPGTSAFLGAGGVVLLGMLRKLQPLSVRK